MNNKIEHCSKLRILAEALELDNREILEKYSDYELAVIYNGIGSDGFPEWLRNKITKLHPTLEVVALIHDVEWHESDKTISGFNKSNASFKENGYIAAKAKYGWWNPLRYVVMNDARKFGNICQIFGWSAWLKDCECDICKERGSNV